MQDIQDDQSTLVDDEMAFPAHAMMSALGSVQRGSFLVFSFPFPLLPFKKEPNQYSGACPPKQGDGQTLS